MPRRSIFLSDDGKGGAEQVGENVGESDDGSLSEASDHTPVDDTSSHPEDPVRIQPAKARGPATNKPNNKSPKQVSAGGAKGAPAVPAAKETDDDDDEDSENESVEESDKNDDDDYRESSSDSPEEDDSDDLDYGETTRRKKPPTRRKKPLTRNPPKRPTRKQKQTTTPSKVAMRTPTKRKVRRGPNTHESSDEQEEVSSEESEEYEEEETKARGRGRGATARGHRQSPRRTTRGKQNSPACYKVVGSSGEESESEDPEEIEEENHSELSEEEQPKRSSKKKQSAPKRASKKAQSPQKRGRPPRRAGVRSKRGKAPSYKDVGSSGGESSESDERDNHNQNEDYEESEGSEGQRNGKKVSAASSSKRPSRSAAAKATARMAQIRYKQEKDDADEEEDEDDKVEQEDKVKPRARKRRKVDSDEEDFQMDEDAENEDDDVELQEGAKSSGEESFLKGVASVPSDSQVGNADSSDFCEDEVSENDSPEETADIPSPKDGLTIQETAAGASRPQVGHSSSDDDDDDEEAEIEPMPTKGKLSQQERTRPAARGKKKVQQRLLHCPSTVDAITEDPLPKVHVCYVSPDGKSRQCFSLETIHKIATTSQHPQYRTNLSDEQQLTFLQPPHFRSAMADELLDQIASRFGRQALDLNGYFYNGKKDAATTGAISSSDDDEGAGENEYQVTFTRSHTSTETFNKAWRIFQMKTMGNQDVYPCPLCYCAAHHRLREPREDQICLPAEFSSDPMAVLGSPDNSSYRVAAGFCFTRIAQVKEHLREAHNCDTARIENALFFRYKIRAPDGLLQRYLAKSRGRNPIQGDMTRYWYNGNSEEYIYLLYQMEKLRERKEKNSKEEDEDDESDSPWREFCDSFQEQALNLWEQMRGPFSAGKEHDMEDFLAADGDDEDGGEEDGEHHPHHVFNQEQAAAEQQNDEELARFYAAKAAEKDDEESSEDEEEDYVSAADASESESEVDEWVAQRTQRRKPSRLSNKNGIQERARRKSARKQRGRSMAESSDEELDECEHEPTAATKRAVFEDSDSD